eukprot:10609249-Karenia_brevis.AAC.1
MALMRQPEMSFEMPSRTLALAKVMRYSGAFDHIKCFGPKVKRPKLCSWNGRAILHHLAQRRRVKLSLVKDAVLHSHVMALQE